MKNFLWMALIEIVSPSCVPINIVSGLGKKAVDPSSDHFYTISFITETSCKELPQLHYKCEKPSKECELVFDFSLEDVYVSSIRDPVKKASAPVGYIRYYYEVKLVAIPNHTKFSYSIRFPSSKEAYKTYNFHSRVFAYEEDPSISIEFLGLADHLFVKDKEYLKEALLKEDFDVIVMMGDYAYELADDFGLRADNYFNLMSDLFARAPALLAGGNHDIWDFGRLMNFRFRFPGASKADDNIQFYAKVGPIFFFFFNFDLFFYNTHEMKNIFIKKQQIARRAIESTTASFRFFVSHRPFYCINKMSNDRCNLWDMMTEIEPLFSTWDFDVIFTGHKHLYQRLLKKDLSDLWWYPTVNVPEKLSPKTLNIIVGAAGQAEHDLYDTPRESWAHYVNSNGYKMGYFKMTASKDKFEGRYKEIDRDLSTSLIDWFEFLKGGTIVEKMEKPVVSHKSATAEKLFSVLPKKAFSQEKQSPTKNIVPLNLRSHSGSFTNEVIHDPDAVIEDEGNLAELHKGRITQPQTQEDVIRLGNRGRRQTPQMVNVLNQIKSLNSEQHKALLNPIQNPSEKENSSKAPLSKQEQIAIDKFKGKGKQEHWMSENFINEKSMLRVVLDSLQFDNLGD